MPLLLSVDDYLKSLMKSRRQITLQAFQQCIIVMQLCKTQEFVCFRSQTLQEIFTMNISIAEKLSDPAFRALRRETALSTSSQDIDGEVEDVAVSIYTLLGRRTI